MAIEVSVQGGKPFFLAGTQEEHWAYELGQFDMTNGQVNCHPFSYKGEIHINAIPNPEWLKDSSFLWLSFTAAQSTNNEEEKEKERLRSEVRGSNFSLLLNKLLKEEI